MGNFQWVTIINPQNNESAFLISIFRTNTNTIFVKLNATIKGIKELEPQFLTFCKSFNFNKN